MSAKTELPPVPPALADVALVDGPTCAAAASEAISTFHDGVRRTAIGKLAEGEVPYPQPVIRRPRFTRWRLADVRAWLIERALQQSAETATAVTEQARKASAKARSPAAVAKARATRSANAKARVGGA
jgi:hypothetical protein